MKSLWQCKTLLQYELSSPLILTQCFIYQGAILSNLQPNATYAVQVVALCTDALHGVYSDRFLITMGTEFEDSGKSEPSSPLQSLSPSLGRPLGGRMGLQSRDSVHLQPLLLPNPCFKFLAVVRRIGLPLTHKIPLECADLHRKIFT